MRALIIGAGERTRAVLGRLGERWDVTVIDTDQGRLDRAAAVRSIGAVLGDPTSRVILRRAGLADADAVVVASLDDEHGLEVCRFAKEANVSRIVALAAELDNLPALFTRLLLVAALAVKVVPSLLLMLRRHSLREAVAAGALLSARLSLIIVVAELGVQLGLLDRTLQAQIILLAVGTATLSPALFRWLLPHPPGSRQPAAGEAQPGTVTSRLGVG